MLDDKSKSQSCYLYDEIKDGTHNVLYFATTGSDIFYLKNKSNTNDNLNIDFRLLETTNENDIDWEKYDYIMVPDKQTNTNIKQVMKYKNAVISYSDGSDGTTPYYDFQPELFANCIFNNSRAPYFRWLVEDENKITDSKCFFKPAIFEKYGFKNVLTTIDMSNNVKMFVYKKEKI